MSAYISQFSKENEAFQKVVTSIRQHANRPLSDEEASDAARNLIGLFRCLLAIHQKNVKNEQCAQ